MIPPAEIVDVDALWKTVVAAMVAGVGVTVTFSLALLAIAKAQEARSREQRSRTFTYAALTGISLLELTGLVILGLIAMTNKYGLS
jgi:hypothetical protein